MKRFVQILYIFTRLVTYIIIPTLVVLFIFKSTIGFVICAIASSSLIFVNFFVFSKYTIKYPLNSLAEYEIKMLLNKFDFLNDVLTIVFINDKGIYKTVNGRKNIVINLIDYPFPEAYIDAFITRQIRYSDIGEGFSISKIYKSRYRSQKYRNLLIDIHIHESNNIVKKHQFYAVKNQKHCSKWLINDINRSPYCDYFIVWRTQKELYKKIRSYDENKYHTQRR